MRQTSWPVMASVNTVLSPVAGSTHEGLSPCRAACRIRPACGTGSGIAKADIAFRAADSASVNSSVKRLLRRPPSRAPSTDRRVCAGSGGADVVAGFGEIQGGEGAADLHARRGAGNRYHERVSGEVGQLRRGDDRGYSSVPLLSLLLAAAACLAGPTPVGLWSSLPTAFDPGTWAVLLLPWCALTDKGDAAPPAS